MPGLSGNPGQRGHDDGARDQPRGRRQALSRIASSAPYTDLVIGAGAAGLAAGAMLRSRGRRPLIIERSDRVGASWLSRYDCLKLNTVSWLSSLPGMSIPRSFGSWVRATDYARYLAGYAAHHRLDVRFGTTARRIDRVDGEWAVMTDDDALYASTVIVAAGYDQSPRIPDWPGLEQSDLPVMHSSQYQNAKPFAGQRVLIVGGGNSAADIAVELAQGGAAKVWLSVRTPPQIVPRSVLGIPVQTVAVLTRRLPPAIGDGIVRFLQRRAFGDLSGYGLPAPTEGVSSQFRRSDVVPIIDVNLVDAIKARQVEVVAAVDRVEGREVILRDGSRLTPDSIIAATGFRRGLENLVGHLGVLGADGRPLAHGSTCPAGAPGLYFIGFTNPLSGNLRELGIDARRIAAAIAAGNPQVVAEQTAPA